MGISVFPTPNTDAHADAAGSRRPCAACVADPGNAGHRGDKGGGTFTAFPGTPRNCEDGGDVPGRREAIIYKCRIMCQQNFTKV